jgi:hypothetical protein
VKSTSTKARLVRVAAATIGATVMAFTPVAAQPAAAGKDQRVFVLLPGTMTGPGTFGPVAMRRLCDPRSVGLTQWRIEWVERIVKPAEAQKKALDELAAASAKAIDIFSASCPKRVPRLQTAPAQLEMMEKRIDSALQAVKAVRPALDAFYGALDERQKARVDELGPKRQGWLW